MKAPRAIGKISPEVARKCKNEGRNISISDVSFVVSRFVHYVRLAAVNGFLTSAKDSNRYFKLQLCRQIFGKLSKQEKQKYFISPRLLSFMFYINVQVGYNIQYKANFIACDEFANMIKANLETDLVYKFIGR